MFDCAFPDDGNSPALIDQHMDVSRISRNVLLKLLQPELRVGFWCCGVAAALMTMPKAAVNKYHSMMFSKDKVWASRKLC
jgi:hypothetical protein